VRSFGHPQGTAVSVATDNNFDALRIEPYLRVIARRNSAVADRLLELAERTTQNILIGPAGPFRTRRENRRPRLRDRAGREPRDHHRGGTYALAGGPATAADH
jgi:hypothetical protein